jgi:hypothetical protein
LGGLKNVDGMVVLVVVWLAEECWLQCKACVGGARVVYYYVCMSVLQEAENMCELIDEQVEEKKKTRNKQTLPKSIVQDGRSVLSKRVRWEINRQKRRKERRERWEGAGSRRKKGETTIAGG